jgi:Domain of unknown function (DUF1998)
MAHYPIRRAQLIAPFGVGAMMVVQDGISLITGGLDHWYEREDGSRSSQEIDKNEFRVEEWRLQQSLRVDYFCLPPDFRDVGDTSCNKFLKIPFLRFPQWHFCPGCKRLSHISLTARGRIKCPECEKKKKRWYLVQVPFVAMCDRGHLQDFPWREWVHKSIQPICDASMRIIATGGSSLAAQKVRCDCGMERTLAQITYAKPDGTETELSKNLDENGNPYLCPGKRPWLGEEENSSCDHPLRGSLRSASNLYYADIRSAIYLPRSNSEVPSNLVSLLEEPPLSVLVNLLSSTGREISPSDLRSQQRQLLSPFSDVQVKGALRIVQSHTAKGTDLPGMKINNDDPETAFRREEFDTLRKSRDDELLIIRTANVEGYKLAFNRFFSRIMLVGKLRETRAFAGFTRVFPENDMPLEERNAMLRLSTPSGEDSWLPAYIVYGEGIFLELNEVWLQIWEKQENVLRRMTPLLKRYEQLEQKRKVRKKPIGPRFILLHTLSHLVMNRLTFECGYSSAALRERLYVSEDPDAPMAGLLIYTAAGDSEGTMGGLVRMGKPGNLEPVIQQALIGARWCSADPVCMEMGALGGQGPESCNLAACHNCSLVPETACEEFNRFLDRAVVIGKAGDRELGYFDIDSLLR